jgi:uncharacterized protein YjbI with pentapeptide repeats
MPSKLDELRDRALEEAAKTGTLNDITQAITVAKTVAEERKATEDLASAGRSLRFAHTQFVVTGLTAIISVLGLIATSVYNIAQISATRAQIETTEWRDLLSSLDNPNLDIAQSLTVPFRLRSFASSARYSEDARLIGAGVISKVADFVAFQQLFNFIFADQRGNDINTMAEIQRQLYSAFVKTNDSCSNMSQRFKFPNTQVFQNVCWNGYTDKQIQDFGVTANDSEVWSMRKKYGQQSFEMTFMSSKIAAALPRTVANNAANKDLKFTNVHFQNSDFSNVDLTGVDISGDNFSACQLTNAKLLPAKFDGVIFFISNWWDAAIIDKDLLQMLIKSYYPDKGQHFFAQPPRPTRLEYVSAVLALCHKADLTCTEAHIPYENE